MPVFMEMWWPALSIRDVNGRFHRRAGYFFMQLVVFVGTAAAIYLLLINGVYHL
jgi:hypothetical protein